MNVITAIKKPAKIEKIVTTVFTASGLLEINGWKWYPMTPDTPSAMANYANRHQSICFNASATLYLYFAIISQFSDVLLHSFPCLKNAY